MSSLPLHIGIDISQVAYTGTGVARFTRGLIDAILESKTDHRYTFFFSGLNRRLDPEIVAQITHSGHTSVRWYLPPRALAWLWNERGMQSIGTPLPGQFDVWISSDWTQPPPQIAHKRVTILHDMVYALYPDTVDPLILNTQTHRLERVAVECDLIISDSKSTQHDFEQKFPSFSGTLETWYPGVGDLPPAASTLPPPLEANRYFLAVGKLEPRKNYTNLISAFEQFVESDARYSAYKLAIVGPNGWGDQPHSSNPNVLLLGHVSDEVLSRLYADTTALGMPSLYEGFGYPVVEAMKSGCPVIASDVSSLAELIADGAGIGVNPNEVSSISDAMIKLASHPEARTELSKRGRARASQYSWNDYVAKLLSACSTV
ncbi:MAG: glycosyltransferase family 1 protein [bacterium]